MNILKILLMALLSTSIGFNVFGAKKKDNEKKRKITYEATSETKKKKLNDEDEDLSIFDFTSDDQNDDQKKWSLIKTPEKKQRQKTPVFKSPLSLQYKIKNTLKSLRKILNASSDQLAIDQKVNDIIQQIKLFNASLSTDARIKDVRFSLALYQLLFIEINNGNPDYIRVIPIKNKEGHVVGGWVGTLLQTDDVNFIIEFRFNGIDEEIDTTTFCLPHKNNRDKDTYVITMSMNRLIEKKKTKEGKIKLVESNSRLSFSRAVLKKNFIDKNLRKSIKKRHKAALKLKSYDEQNSQIVPRKILTLFRSGTNLKTTELKEYMLTLYKRINKNFIVKKNREMPKELKIKNKSYEPERFYQLLFADMLKLIWDLTTEVEIPTEQGRTDVIIKIGNYVYVLEFKYNQKNANIALQQIKDKKYCERFINDGVEIFMLGINVKHNHGDLDIEMSECEKFEYDSVDVGEVSIEDFLKDRLKK